MAIDVKVSFQSGDFIPRIPGATIICQACCSSIRLFPVTAQDGLPAVEAFCTARKHPSVLLRDGKVIGTSA